MKVEFLYFSQSEDGVNSQEYKVFLDISASSLNYFIHIELVTFGLPAIPQISYFFLRKFRAYLALPLEEE